jgi:DNA-binding transcriptional LysR family regulator
MNDFSNIELFARTIEAGSFSELGRRLHMAPSSISRQINALEKELGARLLQRTTRKISLTEAGQIYYERISKILSDLDEARQAISQLQAEPKGILRINAAIPFGERKLVPVIPEFLDQYPDVQVDLTLEDRAIDLVKERVDLAIRIGKLDDSSIVARKLADNRFVVCSSKQYFKAHGQPRTPEELSQHNCLINKNIYNSNTWQFRKNNSTKDITVTGNFQTNTGGSVYRAMLSHLGIAVFPTWFIGEEIKQGLLQTVLEDYEVTLPALTQSGVYALYPAGQYLPPKVRVFIDYLIEKLEL